MRTRLAVVLLCAGLVVVPMARGAFPQIGVALPAVPSSGWFRDAITVTFTVPAGSTPGGNCFQVGANSFPVTQQGSTTLTCSATNGDGTDQKTVVVRIDSVAPTITSSGAARPPDSAGWYNHPVAFNASGTDPAPGSGLAGCGSASYGGPDAASATVAVSCTDNAGNSSSAQSPPFQYDSTPPAVTGGGATRAPDANGWFNHAVVVNFTGTDNLSGIAGCPAVTYAGPDGAGAAVPSSCRDVAGNVSNGSIAIRYDGTAPSVGAALERPPDANGWYGRPVGVNFTGSDVTSGVGSCTSTTFSGPEGVGAASGSCVDGAGNTGSGSVEVRYDASAPEVTALTPERAADAGGFFNHPVGLRFEGRDTGSGVDSCTALTYAGPDSDAASVAGTCVDKAGHASAPKTFKIKYDTTPPSLSGVVAQVGSKFALLKWKASNDVAMIDVTRTPGRAGEASTVVFHGKADFFKDVGIDNGTKYEYVVVAADPAANTVKQTAVATPLPALYAPATGARVRTPVQLEWLPDARATYYNVQIWCGKRKILTAWPTKPRLLLRRRGVVSGHRYLLPKRACRWYVWPGYGKKIDRRYGRLLGSSAFAVIG